MSGMTKKLAGEMCYPETVPAFPNKSKQAASVLINSAVLSVCNTTGKFGFFESTIPDSYSDDTHVFYIAVPPGLSGDTSKPLVQLPKAEAQAVLTACLCLGEVQTTTLIKLVIPWLD